MFKKLISLFLSFTLIFTQPLFAQGVAQLNLGSYLSTVGQSIATDRFRPLRMRYFSYDLKADNFQLLLDKGDDKDIDVGNGHDRSLQEKTKVLMEYFQIGLALPNDKFWVNLRPDAQDEMIDPELEKTDMGKIMLEADLQLKRDTALSTSPQTTEGKAYWDKLYKKAGELFGTENITIPTITRPWIVPGEVILRQGEDSAYIFKANMKVLLEEDYLKSHQDTKSQSHQYNFNDPRMKELNEYSTQLIRELIIPRLTKEVNSSKRYASLRQVFFSLVMARWFKDTFSGKSGQYAKLIDSHNLVNLTSKEAWDKAYYFNEYKKSFEQGEYNLKENITTPTGQVIRSYVSGGELLVNSKPTGLYRGLIDEIVAHPNGSLEWINEKKVELKNGESSSSLRAEDLNKKHIVHPDAHGELERLQENLRHPHVKFIDENGNWIGGNGVLTIAGDIIDRGLKSIETYRYLKNLKIQAQRVGGEVRIEIGNHELMLVMGRYAEAIKSGIENPEKLAQEIKRDILSGILVAACAIGDRLIIHGGLRSKIRELIKDEIETRKGMSRQEIIEYDIASMLNELLVEAVKNNDFSHPMFDVDPRRNGKAEVGGIFWNDARDLFDSIDANKIKQIVGHTPWKFLQDSEGNGRWNDDMSLIALDAGLYDGYGGNHAVIIIENMEVKIVFKEKGGEWQEESLGVVSKKYSNVKAVSHQESEKSYMEKLGGDGKGGALRTEVGRTNQILINAGTTIFKMWFENGSWNFSVVGKGDGVKLGLGKFKVGRSSEGNDFVYSGDGWLSRDHFQINLTKHMLEDTYYLIVDDLRSKHGTVVEIKDKDSPSQMFSNIPPPSKGSTDGFMNEIIIEIYEKFSSGDVNIQKAADAIVEGFRAMTENEYMLNIKTAIEILKTANNQEMKEVVKILEKYAERTRHNGLKDEIQTALNKVGGIDFRTMNYLVQPMGSFKDLRFSLPTLSSSVLEKINLDVELESMRNMVKIGIVPSGERVKEYLAACFQKGKIEERQDDLLVCLAEIYRLAEEENLETSPELRESLVIVDTGKFVLLPNNQRVGLN